MDQSLADAQLRRAALERLFEASLPDIQRVARFVARRQRLTSTEADDFCSEVSLALIESDYAVLAAFQGRSSLRTYLTTVIQRQFLDYRRKLWGKWRPSAEALRRGPLALRLEILLHREGLSFDEAIETLKTNLACEESREALAEIAAALPPRPARRARAESGEEGSSVLAGDLASPEVQLEGRETAARAQVLVNRLLEALEAQDRIILRLRFEDDISVADIARTLHVDQKRLYRRVEVTLNSFRKSLEEGGLGWQEVARMIERGQCHLCLPPEASEKGAARPSPREEQP